MTIPAEVNTRLREIRDTYGIKPAGDTAERRFKRVVRRLHEAGLPPTPSYIRYCCFLADRPFGQGNRQHGPNLNGREARWRREVLTALGYTQRPDDLQNRWIAPATASA